MRTYKVVYIKKGPRDYKGQNKVRAFIRKANSEEDAQSKIKANLKGYELNFIWII